MLLARSAGNVSSIRGGSQADKPPALLHLLLEALPQQLNAVDPTDRKLVTSVVVLNCCW